MKKRNSKQQNGWYLSSGYNGNACMEVKIADVKRLMNEYKGKDYILVDFPEDIKHRLENEMELIKDVRLLKRIIEKLLESGN